MKRKDNKSKNTIRGEGKFRISKKSEGKRTRGGEGTRGGKGLGWGRRVWKMRAR